MRNCSTCGSVDAGHAAPIGRVAAQAIDEGAFSINGTAYTLTLDSIELEGQTVTVDLTYERDGSTAIVTDMLWFLRVNGVEVDSGSRSASGPVTLSGPASAGDTVTVVMATEQFGGHSAAVEGHISSNGNGGGGGGGGGGSTGAGVGLLLLAGIALWSRSKSN